MASTPHADHDNPEVDAQGLHPDAPRHKSPIMWMGLMMLVLVVLTTISMWGEEKISIKANVTIPNLSTQAQVGRKLFAEKCQECHGVDGAGGSRKGPPLVHPMYREDQYPDFMIGHVIRDGKREKNWRFGPMPAIKGLDKQQIQDLTDFIREVQIASGIEGGPEHQVSTN